MTAPPPVRPPQTTRLAIRWPVVLIGLMGAGKSSIGRRLARVLGVPFTDADEAIVDVVGLSVASIFERFGEAAFRLIERQTIIGLLDGAPGVLATGGGAFIDAEIRQAVAAGATSVWLRADLDLLVRRTTGRPGRPLLATGDARATLARLIAERYPVYAKADIVVDTQDDPPDVTVQRVLDALVNRSQQAAGCRED